MNRTEVNILTLPCVAPGLYQWDYGQVLVPTGVELPETYEVHFKVTGSDTTMTILGTADGVLIPDELLTVPGKIVCYIYLHTGADDGETEYKITVPVRARPQPSDYEPTPVQQDVITQTIAALNNAVQEVQDTIPAGGTTGQVLAKASDADRDTEWVNQSGGGGGTSDYADLSNKPKINNVELNGNKSLSDLGIDIPTKTSDLYNDSGYITFAPVQSVNSKTGAVTLNASDVGALPSTTTIPTKTSDLVNDSGYITSAPVSSVNSKTGAVVLSASDVGAVATEVDPTVPSWAKQPNKPTYTASEVGALPDTYTAPVSSVNGKTGAVSLSASDVGALPDSTTIPSKTSQLQNDSGFLTSAVTSFNGNTGAVTYTAPVTSVNGATGAVVIGNATTASAGLMSAQDKTDLGTLMADYSSALTALGVI